MGPNEACLTVFIVIGRYQTDPRNQTSFEKNGRTVDYKTVSLKDKCGNRGIFSGFETFFCSAKFQAIAANCIRKIP